jgi:hypothetical protein
MGIPERCLPLIFLLPPARTSTCNYGKALADTFYTFTCAHEIS